METNSVVFLGAVEGPFSYNRSIDDIFFPEYDFVLQGHEPILHIGLESVYEVYALVKERFEEFLLAVFLVGKHLSLNVLGEYSPYPFIPVIHIRSCKTEDYNIPESLHNRCNLKPWHHLIVPFLSSVNPSKTLFRHLLML